MFALFIRRPVLSVVISLIIVLLGVLSLVTLPMAQYPSIAPPEVNVTVEYTGGNAESVTKAALVPLERAINGVPGMKYMSSDAANDGVGVIQIIFDAGIDPDVAAVNVQNRVSAVLDELPAEVIKNGVRINKEENAMLMYINIFSTDTAVDEKFLYNFADINVLAELKRVKGVGFADILGAREYAMRIWLKPDKLVAYRLSPADVVAALRKQNVEAAPGKLGESNDRVAQSLQYVVRYTGRYNTPEQYANIPIKADETGEILRIRDVADVEFGTIYFDVETKLNGRPCAALVLKQLPGSNANETIEQVKARMAELKKNAFLPGMDYEYSYDVSRFLEASVHEVVKTLIEAFLLVSLVVFLFLQDWRSTLIPAITVPVSLIGTFLFMSLLGFSLNLITLFALVLAIGIVIDDAIVVVEAVHAKMEEGVTDVREATIQAMQEIGGAIIAITLVMSAVFLPTTFLSGPVGIFYRQFSATMAISIILSGVGALTLTPALCALFLRPHHHEDHGLLGRFFRGFNRVYDRVSGRYQRVLGFLLQRRLVMYGVLLAFAIGAVGLGMSLPAGFIPNEDQGTFYVSVTTPAGATLERTKAVVDQLGHHAQGLEGVTSVSTLAGMNILADGTGATYGTCLVDLKPWDERTISVEEVMAQLKEKTAMIKDANLEFFPPPPVPGYGNASGFELRVLDKTGTDDVQRLNTVVQNFLTELRQQPEVGGAFTIFDATFPQYLVHVDGDKAAQKGVSVDDIMSTLQTMMGSEYATNFIKFGQMYKVMVQALPQYRAQPRDMLKLMVKNEEGEMVPMSALVRLEKVYGVDYITRYNMYPSAELHGEPAHSASSGEAIEAVKRVAEKLPHGYYIDWAGMTRDEVQAGNQAVWVFLMCLLFVYLLLSAQYESFLLPFSVILSLPIGVFGAFFLLTLMGLENNIYAQVGLVMLIGLLGKNAILIVEYAIQQEKAGSTIINAAIEGARLRLRPILMTSFAFIAGLIPLLIATGAGAVGNRTIGATAAGGMLLGTVFGVLVIPGLYVAFATLQARFVKPKAALKPALAPLSE